MKHLLLNSLTSWDCLCFWVCLSPCEKWSICYWNPGLSLASWGAFPTVFPQYKMDQTLCMLSLLFHSKRDQIPGMPSLLFIVKEPKFLAFITACHSKRDFSSLSQHFTLNREFFVFLLGFTVTETTSSTVSPVLLSEDQIMCISHSFHYKMQKSSFFLQFFPH